MANTAPPDRCRIVLIVPADAIAKTFAPRLRDALAGGDVASVILPKQAVSDDEFQAFAEIVVPIAQAAGAAALIEEDTRIAGRVGADGVHLEVKAPVLLEAVERLQERWVVGAGGAKTRDEALELGEARPDYVFFGRFGYDTRPEPHHRNLTLGAWWAEMIEIPCVVMAGSDIESVADVAATGAEFVALSRAVFGEGVDPRAAVARANAILENAVVPFEA